MTLTSSIFDAAATITKSRQPSAPRRLQMQALIKQLSVPVRPHQSRLMEPRRQRAPEVSTPTHGLKVRLPSVPARP
jgi:hypothetical protein